MVKNTSKLHKFPIQKTKRPSINLFKLRNADITACWGCRYTSGPEALAEFILDPGFTQFLCIFNLCTLSVIFKTSINFDEKLFYYYFQSLISKFHIYKKLLHPTLENLEFPSQRNKEMKNYSSTERPCCNSKHCLAPARRQPDVKLTSDCLRSQPQKGTGGSAWVCVGLRVYAYTNCSTINLSKTVLIE